jgi:hypothetical protein
MYYVIDKDACAFVRVLALLALACKTFPAKAEDGGASLLT